MEENKNEINEQENSAITVIEKPEETPKKTKKTVNK